ncbi:transposase/IS protein [Pelotomaculum sp. FP]|nr:transposase/IS protein [Pelotomaculum sp. FP]
MENRVVRKRRLLRAANFEVVKTFERYNFDNIQIPPSITVKDITNARFLARKENLILYGAIDTSKSDLATAIGVKARNQGKKVYFFKTAALVNQLINAKAQGELQEFLKRLEKADLLICDEWGYTPLEKEGAQLLFQVISDCYEKRSVIIITNLEFSRWNSIFYDEKMTAITTERLIHHSHLLVFTGFNYR